MIIKNRDEIATTELRGQALDIIEAGIDRVLPPNVMRSSVKYDSDCGVLTIEDDSYDVSKGRMFVIGAGKASGLMAETLETIIDPEEITAGVVNCKSVDYRTERIKLIEAGHPIPDERGISGAREMLSLKEKYSITDGDFVICLISGGGSALMPSPVDGVSLEDKQKITKLLLGSGAEIHEINAVRKHLSKLKGGRLGQFFSPAKVLSLIISDVIGNNLDIIASGPAYPDSSTFSDAYSVLERYGLEKSAPRSVKTHLKRGCEGEVEETPKTLKNCYNYIIGDNMLALEAMASKAEDMGFSPYIVTSEQKGDPAAAARLRADEILNGEYQGHDVILIGGETTPKLPDSPGKGGRNQHYAVASMLAMENYSGSWIAASVGTDGSDFMADVAGAIVDNSSLDQVKAKEIDVNLCLDRCDSNTLLKKIGNALVITGNTGTNVCDVMIYLLR